MFRLSKLVTSPRKRCSHSSFPLMYTTLPLQRTSLDQVRISRPMKIHLTDSETRICNLLHEFTLHLQEVQQKSTTCRIAGGWVRDKLLGRDSNDIDIALSNMMGLSFAEHLAVYAQTKGIHTGTISKIAQNPEQSKHLETATFKLYGLDVDLVNLRSEEYTETSRIPTGITFGTPLEDARRRDITINALFYNVHTHEVEDFTEKGLDDLINGIIRTPLPPKETFQDDPLRVIRCIRFASRFGFSLVPELEEAARDRVIQEALVSKVARERVGDEIAKMMKGRDPLRSIELIHRLSLFHPIFSAISPNVTSAFSTKPASPDMALSMASVSHLLLKSTTSELPKLHPVLTTAIRTDPSCQPRLYLAAALTPFMGVTYLDKRGKSNPAVGIVIREALKLGTQYHFLDGIPLLFSSVKKVEDLLSTLASLDTTIERSSIGLALRDKSVHSVSSGAHWSTSILFSLVTELAKVYDVVKDHLDVEKATALIEKYNILASKIEHLGLLEVGEEKPLFDGREVVAALSAKKGGPWLADALLRILQWQLDHPNLLREDCLQWLKEEKISGRIRISDESSQPTPKRPRLK